MPHAGGGFPEPKFLLSADPFVALFCFPH
ncbi:LEPR-XLL domain-containing protein [Peribacillus frigoritolerans]